MKIRKSKKITKISLRIAVIMIILLVTALACDNGSTSNSNYNNDAGSFAGYWSGFFHSEIVTIQVSNSGWAQHVRGYPNYDTGSFNRTGNTATLYSNVLRVEVGTVTIMDNNILQVYLNSHAEYPGTYTIYRNRFIGSWSGTLTLPQSHGGGSNDVTSNSGHMTWTVSIPDMSLSENGFYSISNSTTAIFYNSNNDIIGNSVLSNNNNTLTVTITEEGGDIPKDTVITVNRN